MQAEALSVTVDNGEKRGTCQALRCQLGDLFPELGDLSDKGKPESIGMTHRHGMKQSLLGFRVRNHGTLE